MVELTTNAVAEMAVRAGTAILSVREVAGVHTFHSYLSASPPAPGCLDALVEVGDAGAPLW